MCSEGNCPHQSSLVVKTCVIQIKFDFAKSDCLSVVLLSAVILLTESLFSPVWIILQHVPFCNPVQHRPGTGGEPWKLIENPAELHIVPTIEFHVVLGTYLVLAPFCWWWVLVAVLAGERQGFSAFYYCQGWIFDLTILEMGIFQYIQLLHCWLVLPQFPRCR